MEKKKKGVRSKIIWCIIAIATAYIVYASVKIGMDLAKKIDDGDSTEEKESLNSNEKTKDFDINYTEESYKLENNNKVVIAENRRNIPVITSEKYQESADKIVSFLTELSNTKWAEIKSAADDYSKLELTKKVGVDYIISNLNQTEHYFSFKIEIKGSMGGVSWDDEKVYTFNPKNGELLTFENISSDVTGLRQLIYKKLVEVISNQEYSKDLDSEWKNRLVKEIITSGNWYLSDEGINYCFPKYTFGPGYIGVIKHTIKYEEINDFLNSEYKKNA